MTTLTRHGSPPSLGHDNTIGTPNPQQAPGRAKEPEVTAITIPLMPVACISGSDFRALGNAPSSYTSPKEMKVRNTT